MDKLLRKNKKRTKWIVKLGKKKYLLNLGAIIGRKTNREEDLSLQPLDCLHPSPRNKK